MRLFSVCTFILVLIVSTSYASNQDAEQIEYLLAAVGNSGCVFIRNGGEHAAGDAEKHLRMKYRRGKKWATTVEKFISRIGTQSSISRKPYMMRCEKKGTRPTADWLRERLLEYSNTGQKMPAESS